MMRFRTQRDVARMRLITALQMLPSGIFRDSRAEHRHRGLVVERPIADRSPYPPAPPAVPFGWMAELAPRDGSIPYWVVGPAWVILPRRWWQRARSAFYWWVVETGIAQTPYEGCYWTELVFPWQRGWLRLFRTWRRVMRGELAPTTLRPPRGHLVLPPFSGRMRRIAAFWLGLVLAVRFDGAVGFVGAYAVGWIGAGWILVWPRDWQRRRRLRALEQEEMRALDDDYDIDVTGRRITRHLP